MRLTGKRWELEIDFYVIGIGIAYQFKNGSFVLIAPFLMITREGKTK